MVDTTALQPPLLPPGQGKVSSDPSAGENSTIAAAASLNKSIEHGTSDAKKGFKVALWVIMLIVIAGAALFFLVCFCVLRSYRSRHQNTGAAPAHGGGHASQTPYAEPNYQDDVKYA